MSIADDQSRYDVAIIGAGFAGSILAHILAKADLSVALIDAAEHPRFAIGESSTPIADKLLRRLGEKHDIEAFVQLSTFGSWQANHPEVTCGLKRGFSYYAHEEGVPFQVNSKNSLLVAASQDDEVADTHWYRSEVDEFLFDQAATAGATPLAKHRVTKIVPDDWVQVKLQDQGTIHARIVIDASGPSQVMAKLLNATNLVDTLQTNTRSAFAHFSGVGSWSESHARRDDPFDGDAAAQHHLMGDSWLWMLRFTNDITSVGVTSTAKELPTFPVDDSYSSLAGLFADAVQITPKPPRGPIRTARLQRFLDPIAAPNCWMLPTAAVSIDPLHSTGIAHAMAGIDRIADLILNQFKSQSTTTWSTTALAIGAEKYAHAVRMEARFLDTLTAVAYETMRDFPRFSAACMLYFASAIICEERYGAGETPSRLYNCDDEAFVTTIRQCTSLLAGNGRTQEVVNEIGGLIKPYNNAGLFDPQSSNRYRYTATK